MAQMNYSQKRNRRTVQKLLMVPKENMGRGISEEFGIKRYTPGLYIHVCLTEGFMGSQK